MKTLKVANRWFNDSGDVEIVLLVPLDNSRELRNDLFWYDGNNRPLWSRGTELTDKDVLETHCYKQRKMSSIDDIPNDCFMSMTQGGRQMIKIYRKATTIKARTI